MPHKTHCFTLRANGRLRAVVTDCWIYPGFDPAGTESHPGKNYRAIWDTGATGSVITQKIVDECGLKITGMTKVHGVGGPRNSPVYKVNIGLPSGVGFAMLNVTLAENMPGADALIGMDIIGRGDFAVTNVDGKTVVSFRTPSVQEIDFAVATKAESAKPKPVVDKRFTPSQGAPCPCGSKRKYKHCCGKKVA